MNLKIREFKLSIANYINETEMPNEVKRMVLKEIYEEVERLANEDIKEEFKEREKQNEQVLLQDCMGELP